jgi:CRISPR-associated protein Cmr1
MGLKIKTLTPIWTGDIDSESNSIQSTGIMGSLRWWTEAILRGIGKYVCDPTTDSQDGRCPKKIKKNNQEITQYCLACLIFGATGIRRIFRMYINCAQRTFNGKTINIKPGGRNKGWYLGSGIIGDISLELISLDRDFEENLILVPLVIAAKMGAIGAKTQHGYGVANIEDYSEVEFEKFKNALTRVVDKERLNKLQVEERQETNNLLPCIKEMFFATIQFEADNEWWKGVDGIRERGQRGDRTYYKGYKNDPRMIEWVKSGSVPITPAIKNWLRYGEGKKLWEASNHNKNRIIENWIFGAIIKNDKTASKINISCAYPIDGNIWEFRMWGWIPKGNLPDGFNREDFLNNLKESLSGSSSVQIPLSTLLGNKTRNHTLKVWREFDSSRDIVKPRENNTENYLQSLLKDD